MSDEPEIVMEPPDYHMTPSNRSTNNKNEEVENKDDETEQVFELTTPIRVKRDMVKTSLKLTDKD